VVFWDEDIAVKKDHALSLCEGLLRTRLGISWCASMTVGDVDRELMKIMKRAGCWKLLFGLETGVRKNLDTLGKSLDLSRVRDQLKNVRKAGIESFATFMFGIPGETRSDAEETIRYAKHLPLDYALFLNFAPFPGTELYREMDTLGTFQGIWSTQAVSFVPKTMTLEDLKELRVIAYRRFYLRPRYVLRRLFKIHSMEDVKRNFRGLISALRLRKEGII